MPILNAAAGVMMGLALLGSVSKLLSDDDTGALEPLIIEGADTSHSFFVEIASTRQEQAKGLMHRKTMASDHGMLFPIKPPRQASFWMKNTYISLDMLFLRADGRILQIEANTVPLKEASYRSIGVVAAVLEINGGLCRELGIVPGDTVRHQIFKNLEALAPESSQMKSE
jgi:hypothetical protein